MTSASLADHQLPMKWSILKPIADASFTATWFITPQPDMKIQSGFRRRTCSHVDFCSWPGWSTASSVSSNWYFFASSSSVGFASLPYGLLWKMWAIFLPFSFSIPPSCAPMYLTTAEAWLQYVVGNVKRSEEQTSELQSLA